LRAKVGAIYQVLFDTSRTLEFGKVAALKGGTRIGSHFGHDLNEVKERERGRKQKLSRGKGFSQKKAFELPPAQYAELKGSGGLFPCNQAACTTESPTSTHLKHPKENDVRSEAKEKRHFFTWSVV
jgi:hypothetical protein